MEDCKQLSKLKDSMEEEPAANKAAEVKQTRRSSNGIYIDEVKYLNNEEIEMLRKTPSFTCGNIMFQLDWGLV